MRCVIVQHFVINLVCINNKLMLARDLDDFAQQIIRVECTGRIIGINNDNGTSVGGNLGANIVQIGQPVRFLIAYIVSCRAACQHNCRSPQRIVG